MMDDSVVIAPPPPPSRRVLMLANTNELISKAGKRRYPSQRDRHAIEGAAMMTPMTERPSAHRLRPYDPSNPWFKNDNAFSPGKGGLRVDAGHPITRTTLEPLGDLLAAQPWVPSGAVSQSYDAKVEMPAPDTKRLDKEGEAKIVQRLYAEGTDKQKSARERLHHRYCKPRPQPRKLAKAEMENQYNSSTMWEKKVKGKTDAMLNPKPPPKHAAGGGRGRGKAAAEPLVGDALLSSVTRLHKGALHEDQNVGYGAHRDKLYKKFNVTEPPPTYVHTANGRRPQTERLDKERVAAMAARLCDKSVEHKQSTIDGLVDKYVRSHDREARVLGREDVQALDEYLHTKGEQPGYREGSPKKR